MLVKSLAILAASFVAMTYAADEPITCKDAPPGRSIITSITNEQNFCTMLTPKGAYPVAPEEGCAAVYCQGEVMNGAQPMPTGYIQSAHYVKNGSYVQITGCMDSTVWGQNPTDEGGQMDSHGWNYTCQGYQKFVSLLEPATNTYCIRCCSDANGADVDVDCDTSHSTNGCWNLIPGNYFMADGSNCPLAPGAPGSNTTVSGGVPSATATLLPPATSGAPAASTSAGSAGTAATTGGAQPSIKPSAATAVVSTGSAIAASLVLAVMIAAL